MTTQKASAVTKDCGVRITQVRVANFRSLENIEVDLDSLTILVGANNSGKTSFLDALHAAIGAGRRNLGKEDIHLKKGETIVPLERKAVIDIRVQPCCTEQGKLLDVFPRGSFWTGLWGDNIAQDANSNDFVGIRTEFTWHPTHNEHRLERRFLEEWQPFTDEWLASDAKKSVTAKHLEPIVLHYMDAQRDIEADFHGQGSFWRRLVNDLGFSDTSVQEFEKILSNLNAHMVEESPVLKHIRDHLFNMDHVVTAERTGIDITPIARHLRDLAKGIDIHFATTDAQSFPLTKHGMGTRSLASILVFRAYAAWKGVQFDNNPGQELTHTLLALEEPEAHLHPQAQRSLFRQIKEIPGQRILSTHSPYFAGQARLEELRLFQKIGNNSFVSRLDTGSLGPDDRRKLDHQIIQTRGDILFCRALILFEGQTEELALPVYAQAYWGVSIHELGFNFVPVGGTDYFPLIWLAKSIGIKWYIFSDAEKLPRKAINNCLTRLKIGDISKCSNIFILPMETNYEKYLIDQGYFSEIEESMRHAPWKHKSLDDYIHVNNGKMRNKNETRDYAKEGREAAARDALNENKTSLAQPVAHTIVAAKDPKRRFPKVIAALLEKISADFGLKKAGDIP